MKHIMIIIVVSVTFINSTFGQTKRDSLIVFVGEIIEVKVAPPKDELELPMDTIIRGVDTLITRRVTISMDGEYIAKYKILKLLNGFYTSDTITFTAYDIVYPKSWTVD